MRILIFSDLHGDYKRAEEIKAIWDKGDFDSIFLLGDILYHGPRNDLPPFYCPKKVIPILSELRDYITAVRGNCDADVDQWLLHFPIMAEYSWIMAQDRMIYLTHGHVYGNDFRKGESFPALRKEDVVLSGHTHVPVTEPTDGGLFFNPGSVAIPKQGSKNGYMTLENGLFVWKSFEEGEYARFQL